MNIKLLLCLPLLLWLGACSTLPPAPTVPGPSTTGARYTPVPVDSLPGWTAESHAASLQALQHSCRALARKPKDWGAWQAACLASANVDVQQPAGVRRYFEQYFNAWSVSDGSRVQGLITGYYEPLLNGSRVRTERTPWPVYGVPSDLYTFEPGPAERQRGEGIVRVAGANRLASVPGATQPASGQYRVRLADFVTDGKTTRLKGRLEGDRFVPYYTRAEIEQGRGVSSAPVLAWVEDPTELFFLQVQGSGRIQLEDGTLLRVGYADQNGYGYQSIGKTLVDSGEMTLADASMQGIQAWVRAHPDRRQALFNSNPSYVFFRVLGHAEGGPIGSLGVPLTDGYSIAVDPRYIPLGAPVFLETTWPLSSTPLRRLVHAQDTGGAIKGAVRADFFWGFGTEAGMYAGRMKQQGRLWLLLPKGMDPAASAGR